MITEMKTMRLNKIFSPLFRFFKELESKHINKNKPVALFGNGKYLPSRPGSEAVDYCGLIQEYYQLAIKESISEYEGDRLESILAKAQFDKKLSFLLNEVDEITYEILNQSNDFIDNPKKSNGLGWVKHFMETGELNVSMTFGMSLNSRLIYQNILNDYKNIATADVLSEIEVKRLENILIRAEKEKLLHTLLNEVDDFIIRGRCPEEEYMEEYLDYQAIKAKHLVDRYNIEEVKKTTANRLQAIDQLQAIGRKVVRRIPDRRYLTIAMAVCAGVVASVFGPTRLLSKSDYIYYIHNFFTPGDRVLAIQLLDEENAGYKGKEGLLQNIESPIESKFSFGEDSAVSIKVTQLPTFEGIDSLDLDGVFVVGSDPKADNPNHIDFAILQDEFRIAVQDASDSHNASAELAQDLRSVGFKDVHAIEDAPRIEKETKMISSVGSSDADLTIVIGTDFSE